MDVIEVKRDWSKINRGLIGGFLTRRYYGYGAIFIGISTALIVFSILAFAISYSYPQSIGPLNWLIGSIPLYFTLIAILISNRFWRKKLVMDLNRAPVRTKTKVVYLSEHGLSDFSIPHKNEMTWDYITNVVEYKDVVLLLLSPIEFIPLPDSGLPTGMTRAALLDQIAEWRKAAS